MTLQELMEARRKAADAAAELQKKGEAENRELTPEESKTFDEKIAEVESLTKRLERQSRITDLSTTSTGRLTAPTVPDETNPQTRDKVPAVPKRYYSLKYLDKCRSITDRAKRQELAYMTGRWIRAVCRKRDADLKWCVERGLSFERNESDGAEFRGQTEGTLTAGGYLVPDAIDAAIIDLKESRGVFRQYARSVPMTSDKTVRMRRIAGLTAYFVNEASAITDSSMAWDRVSLVAKDLGAINLISNDLSEDAMVNVGDLAIGEIAYAFADKEDECGFNGDGTSTYGGIIGVRNALLNLSGTIANIAGLFVGTGNLYSELTLSDLANTMALLPQYASMGDVAWYCHKTFWGQVMQRLAVTTAVGGLTIAELEAGMAPRFLGYPVRFSQVMPRIEANSQVCALFGNLALAADYGDRRQTSLKVSEEGVVGSVSLFETNQIAIRGIERFDINVHDVGNASATAASRVPGPIVGLITAAS